MVPAAARQLDRLRHYRSHRRGPATLGAELERQVAALGRAQRGLRGLSAAWDRLVPPAASIGTELASLRRGVLTVKVGDSSSAYVLDRWLRAGGLVALRHAIPGALSRVKIVVRGVLM